MLPLKAKSPAQAALDAGKPIRLQFVLSLDAIYLEEVRPLVTAD